MASNHNISYCQTSIKSNGSDMNLLPRYVLIGGPPGIGKTTLIQKVCQILKRSNIKIQGFYTNEIRDKFQQRNGFDVVTLDGRSEKLARVLNHMQPGDIRNYRVGQYYVFPQKFEELVCPIISEFHQGVLVIDEIGKMELLSHKFESLIVQTQNKENLVVLASIPDLRKNIPLVESLLKNPTSYLFKVDKLNRDGLVKEVIDQLNIHRFIKKTQ